MPVYLAKVAEKQGCNELAELQPRCVPFAWSSTTKMLDILFSHGCCACCVNGESVGDRQHKRQKSQPLSEGVRLLHQSCEQ